MIKRVISNPNYIYIISFSIPFFVYSLGWSTLYPLITRSLIIFYAFTFMVCLLFGTILTKTVRIKYERICKSHWNLFFLCLIYLLYFIELLYSRTIPLLTFITGHEYGEVQFGLPFIHVFVVSFNCFYAIYLFHQYRSTKKAHLLLSYFLLVVPLIILVQRSSIVDIIFGSLYIYMVSLEKIKFSKIFKSFLFILVLFYLFGYLGNLRSANGDPTYIPRASGATNAFLNSSIPKEYYWAYLYISSPVAGFQNNINECEIVRKSFLGFFLYETIPEFISKRIEPLFKVKKKSFIQLNIFLNVGTIYADSFSYLGWTGPILLFLIFILLINLYVIVIRKSFRFQTVGLAIVICLIVFANFHNTISYTTTSLQLIYPLVFSALKIR